MIRGSVRVVLLLSASVVVSVLAGCGSTATVAEAGHSGATADGGGAPVDAGSPGEAASAAEAHAGDGGAPAGTPAGVWIRESAAPVRGATLNAVWAASGDDAWAVGDGGVLLHFDGHAWGRVTSPTKNHLHGVWGSAADDIWAVAGGLAGAGGSTNEFANLIHWDGHTWSAAVSGTRDNLAGVWGSGRNDVWAVGGSGVEGAVVHYDGTSWTTTLTTPTDRLAGVWGSGPHDVWAVGDLIYPATSDRFDDILHFDGAWSSVPSHAPTEQAQVLRAAWGTSASNAYAAGFGSIQHWNGSAWSTVRAPSLATFWNGVWGADANDVFAVGNGSGSPSSRKIAHYDGITWGVAEATGAHMVSVGGIGRGHVWAVGNAVLRFDRVPKKAVDCSEVGGTCGAPSACAVGRGHVSDYSCAGAAETCCVSVDACAGSAEPSCCDAQGNATATRAACHDGAYVCPGGTECPLHP